MILISTAFAAADVRADMAAKSYVDGIIGALGTAAQKNVGVANGVASLDANTKVPIAQIPTGTSGAAVALGNDSRIVNGVRTSGEFTMSGTYTITGTLNVATPPLPPVN